MVCDAGIEVSPPGTFAVRHEAKVTHGKLHLLHPGDCPDDRHAAVMLDGSRCLGLVRPAFDVVEDDPGDPDFRDQRTGTL